MNPRKIVAVATAFASAAFLSIAGAQAATDQEHATRHVVMHHHYHYHHHVMNPVAAGADLAAGAVDTAGAAVATAGAIAAAPFGAAPGGYFASSTWGDFDCRPGYPGCRPYASKDWSTH